MYTHRQLHGLQHTGSAWFSARGSSVEVFRQAAWHRAIQVALAAAQHRALGALHPTPAGSAWDAPLVPSQRSTWAWSHGEARSINLRPVLMRSWLGHGRGLEFRKNLYFNALLLLNLVQVILRVPQACYGPVGLSGGGPCRDGFPRSPVMLICAGRVCKYTRRFQRPLWEGR